MMNVHALCGEGKWGKTNVASVQCMDIYGEAPYQ